MKFVSAVFWMSLVSFSVQAAPMLMEGTGHSGGGGGVLCSDAEGNKTLVTLDYYQAAFNTADGKPARLISMKGTEQEVLDRILSPFKAIGLSQALEDSLEDIGSLSDWKEAPLDIFKDDGKAFILKPGCEYVQLAVRQGNIVFVDLKYVPMLSPGQFALLRLHEAIYKKLKNFDPVKYSDSTFTREIIGHMLSIAVDPIKRRKDYFVFYFSLQIGIFGLFQSVDYSVINQGKWQEIDGAIQQNLLFDQGSNSEFDKINSFLKDDYFSNRKNFILTIPRMLSELKMGLRGSMRYQMVCQQYERVGLSECKNKALEFARSNYARLKGFKDGFTLKMELTKSIYNPSGPNGTAVVKSETFTVPGYAGELLPEERAELDQIEKSFIQFINSFKQP